MEQRTAATELAERMQPLDEDAMVAAFDQQSRQPGGGSLGKLEGLALWLAGIQRQAPPQRLHRKRLVVLAGDHRGPDDGDPAARGGAAVRALLDGTSPVTALAERARVGVRVVDIALTDELDPAPADSVLRHKVSRGSGAIGVEPAATAVETESAFSAGAAIADDEVDSGADLLIAAEAGATSRTAAAALVCAMTGAEPVEAVGRGGGDDAQWARQVAVVRDALRRSRHVTLDPMRLLGELGGADLAAIAGFQLAAAARRTPVFLDGLVTVAAACVVARIAPGAVAYFAAAHRAPDPGQQRALEHLGLQPLLALDIRSGGGVGALLAVPLLDAAVDVRRGEPLRAES